MTYRQQKTIGHVFRSYPNAVHLETKLGQEMIIMGSAWIVHRNGKLRRIG